MDCSTPGFPVFHHLLDLAPTPIHWVSDVIPTVSSSVYLFSYHQSFPVSGSYPNESVIPTRWPKYWSFSFSVTPSKEYSGWFPLGLTSFDFLEVQGTLKNLPHHHSSKASIPPHSAFFMAQLSWSYMTTRKTIALTIQTFISKVFSYALLFNMLFRFVIAFCPREKHHLISCL